MRSRSVAVVTALALAVGFLVAIEEPSQSASQVHITAAGDYVARSATASVLTKVASL